MRVPSEQDLTILLNASGQTITRTFHTFALAVASVHVGSGLVNYSPFGVLLYYSAAVGLWLKVVEYFQDGTLAGEYNLTSFRHTPAPSDEPPPGDFTGALVGIGLVIVGAAAFGLWSRRRRAFRNPPADP